MATRKIETYEMSHLPETLTRIVEYTQALPHIGLDPNAPIAYATFAECYGEWVLDWAWDQAGKEAQIAYARTLPEWQPAAQAVKAKLMADGFVTNAFELGADLAYDGSEDGSIPDWWRMNEHGKPKSDLPTDVELGVDVNSWDWN